MREVASLLDITPRTVAHHKYTMMRSLDIETSAELVQFAVRSGIVSARETGTLGSLTSDSPVGRSSTISHDRPAASMIETMSMSLALCLLMLQPVAPAASTGPITNRTLVTVENAADTVAGEVVVDGALARASRGLPICDDGLVSPELYAFDRDQ